MSEQATTERTEDGFELNGVFYRWHVTDTGKDLMLIDRFTGMPVYEFFEIIEDSFDRGRAPILLALMATSIRAAHPDWSVDRVTRLVMALNLGEVVFIDSDAEEQPVPPADGGTDEATSTSPAADSSPSSTPEGNSSSETLYAIPA